MLKVKLRSKSRIIAIIAMLAISFYPFAETSADDDIAALLSYVIENEDWENAEELYNNLTQDDINSMDTTTLFDYHYIAAYINSEKDMHEEAIFHLLLAKQLCETSLGIYNFLYLDILLGLGNNHIKLGEYDEAIKYYHEGAVKCLSVSDEFPNEFSFLLIALAEAYEQLGWTEEVPYLWVSAWFYWNKEDTPLSEMNYYPLFMLYSYYYRHGEYEEGLNIVGEIFEFVKEKVGESSPEYGKVMYYKGNLLNKLGKNEEAVQAYSKGIDLIMQNNTNDIDDVELLYSNLINAYAELGDIDKINDALSQIRQLKTDWSTSLYVKALYHVSTVLMKAREYDEALEYIRRIISLEATLTEEEKDVVAQREREVIYLQGNSQMLQNLLMQTDTCLAGTPEWFNYNKDLAQAYFTDGQYAKATKTLMIVYNWYEEHDKLSAGELGEIVSWIVNCAQNDEDYETILKVIPVGLNYVKESSEEDSEEYYAALSTMAVAQIRLGKPEQAQETLDTSAPLCLSLYGKNSVEYVVYLHNQGRVYQLKGQLEKARELFNQSIEMSRLLAIPQKTRSRTIECLGEVELKLKETL